MKLCYMEHTQHKVTCKYITHFNVTLSKIISFFRLVVRLVYNEANSVETCSFTQIFLETLQSKIFSEFSIPVCR